MNGDARRAEREAAYAKNPDQPIVKRAQPIGHGGTGDHAASGAAHRRQKPVPVLLQKRKAPETESA